MASDAHDMTWQRKRDCIQKCHRESRQVLSKQCWNWVRMLSFLRSLRSRDFSATFELAFLNLVALCASAPAIFIAIRAAVTRRLEFTHCWLSILCTVGRLIWRPHTTDVLSRYSSGCCLRDRCVFWSADLADFLTVPTAMGR